ncbi:MAG: DUF3857 domain-containing protein [Massilibacteroides sp.]|nr:DUF3857 domain-containing protein [Massilibacteroides sp.]MDD4661129.1 DUF3857 domain-containing protein [Massilibacteroides sp.]
MKRNKLYSYLLLLLFLSTAYPLVTSAQEAEFVKLNKTFVLNEDGSQEFRCYKELKLFTHTAMNSTYGETFIVYNPDFQELEIHSCYTRQKDGTIIKTPENAFVEVLPRFATDAPAYNQLKEMIVVHTGLDLGSTIYLDYSIHTKGNILRALDIDEFLQETSPVLEYKITISVPEKQTLNYQTLGKLKPTEQITQNRKIYSWQLKNIPATSRRPFLPQNKENVLRLTANTYENKNKAFLRIDQQIKESSSMESETFAGFLTESCSSEKEKLDVVLSHVVNNISTTPIPFSSAGYRLRSADEVLRSAYGTEIEKTNLLNKMLNAAGIPSEIVFFYPTALSSGITGLAGIKQVGVKTTLDGKAIYLSALRTQPIQPELRGSLDKVIALSGDQITVEQKPAIYDERQELTLDKTKIQNGYLIYDLPQSKGIDQWHMSALNSRREDWFEIPSMLKETSTCLITIPEGISYSGNTEPVALTNPQGKFSRTIRLNGNKLEIIRTLELKQIQYSPDEYAEVRKLIMEWNGTKNKQLLFKTH